ncbi:MAG: methylmalonyl-CoA mutase family protein [Alphaproteobacteria bacterium]
MAMHFDEPTVTDLAQWRKLAEAVLKGADFDEVLTAKTADGIRIEPIYAKAEGRAPIIGRAAGAPWAIMQRVDDPDVARANKQALTDLENGANGLTLVFKDSLGAQSFGIDTKAESVADTLKGVYLDAGIDIALDCGPRGRDAAHAFADASKALGFPANTLRVRFGLNPIGTGARIGALHGDGAQIAKNVSAAVNDLIAQGFKGPFIAADGRVVHAAGGSEAQELGFVVSCALFYLRGLEASGIALDDARAMIEFRLASDADQFLSIVKHRALRRLWASIEAQCGLEPKPIFITSETASRMLTTRDPWMNVLRNGMGCFAAAIGGANAISILPFTSAIGLADPFARRLARNTQLVFAQESHLSTVADPAAGAGGYEALTDALIEKAWTEFQAIEKDGGVVAALQKGIIQERITNVAVERYAAIENKKAIILGVTLFPDAHEKPIGVLAPSPAPQTPANTHFAPLTALRVAEIFEQKMPKIGVAS